MKISTRFFKHLILKIMKRSFNIILAFAAMLLATGCVKDVLDKKPLTSITDDVVWDDPVLIKAFLNAQYNFSAVMVNECIAYTKDWSGGSPVGPAGLTPQLFVSEQGAGFTFINDLADESMPGWDVAGIVYSASLVKANGFPAAGGVFDWWDYAYYVIRNTSLLIEQVPQSPMEATDAAQVIAEARFLRAFNYFAMVRRYGGVPLITDPQMLTDPKEVLFPARNKEQEIYDFIISEMDAIKDVLPTTGYGRPSKWAALALQSRAALYAGSIAKYGMVQLDGLVGIPSSAANAYYQKAYDAAQAIMNSGSFSLHDRNADKTLNFREVFTTKRNTEMIFVKEHNAVHALTNEGNSWDYDHMQSPKPHPWDLGMGNTPYLELAEAFQKTDGSSGALDSNLVKSRLWTMEELWQDKDPRFFATVYTQSTPWQGGKVDFHNGLRKPDGTIVNESVDGFPALGNQKIGNYFGTGFGVMKYLDENYKAPNWSGTWSGSSTDYTIFRYAEVLLNFAEAAVELGRAGEALTPVNNIRTRAGIATLGSVDLKAVQQERRVELAFEGHRYWDLCRWRIAQDELSKPHRGIRYILDYTSGKYQVQFIYNMDGTTKAPNFKPASYYLPIGTSRRGINSNLLENPGY